MNLIEFKTWIDNLPEEILNYSMVLTQIENVNNEYTFKLDLPITEFNIDYSDKQIYFKISQKIIS
jgi:hypothetical protein